MCSLETTRKSLPAKVSELVKTYPLVINLAVQWGMMHVYGQFPGLFLCGFFTLITLDVDMRLCCNEDVWSFALKKRKKTYFKS